MLQNSFAAEEFNNQCLTRFDEISPSFGQFFDSLFLIRQNVEPSLAKLVHYCANFHCC